MSVRSFMAVLLLINYLLVVAAGCVNRPEDQRERLLVQTISDGQDGQSYQECRYLRMDGLETFLAEALTNRYETATKRPPHHLFFVINGIDAHHLPSTIWTLFAGGYQCACLIVGHVLPVTTAVDRSLYTPPWLG